MNAEPPEAVMLVNQRSPSVQRRILDHALKAEDTQAENTWKSMCLEMDRRAVQYFTQISIIGGVMIFCIFKLTTDTSCVAQQAYTGLLTLLIGILAPSPKFNK